MDRGINILYGRKLRKLREFYNYSQKQCIVALNLKRQQDLSDLEKGKKHFTYQLLLLICDYFKVSYRDFTSFQNLDSFVNLNVFTKTESANVKEIDDLHFENQLLRKHLLMKELDLLQAKREIARRGMEHINNAVIEHDVPIYVLI